MFNKDFDYIYNNLIANNYFKEEIPKIVLSVLYEKKATIKDDVYEYALGNMSKLNADLKKKFLEYSFEKVDLQDFIDSMFEFLNNVNLHNDNSGNVSLYKLIYRLLNISINDKVLDFGSGAGEALYEFEKNADYKLKIYGSEISIDNVMLSQMVFNLLNIKCEVNLGDALFLDVPEFDKGYVAPPFGLRYMDNRLEKFNSINKKYLKSSTNCEWYFVDKLLSVLKPNGKVAALLFPRCLFFSGDSEYRKYVLENKLIETIIQLPSNLLSYTSIAPTLIIFSHNNDSIKVINASNYYVRNKNYNDIDIDKVLADYDNCFTISTKEAIDINDFTVDRLMYKKISIKCPKPIDEISNIIQGSQYTLKNFENQITTEKTKTRLLTSSDIEDGIIQWDRLTSIKDADPKLLKFKLQENDIILTSKSSKVKIAVVDFQPEEDIILTGGMLCIRPNVDIINPLFLKMFLDSNKGHDILKSIQKGQYIPTITASALKSIFVSCPPLETQNDAARKYKSKLSMYSALKKELESLENQINNYYEEVEEDL